MRAGARRVLIALALVLPPFSQLAVCCGMLSARFGRSGGAVTGLLRRRGLWQRDGDDQDDDDNNSFGDGPSRGCGAGD